MTTKTIRLTTKEAKEDRERKIKKKIDSIVRLLKAAQSDIKSTIACVDRYEVEDMEIDEGHTWANGAADKVGSALSIIKELRE